MKISSYLLNVGIIPWLAETHIQEGEHINNSIIKALESTHKFLVFLSPNSLQSRWTGKELVKAMDLNIKLFVIADLNIDSIKNAIQEWLNGSWTYLVGSASSFFNGLFENPSFEIKVFVDPYISELEEFNNQNLSQHSERKVYALQNLPSLIKE